MQIIEYVDREQRHARLAVSRIQWEMLVEIAESLSQTPAVFCGRVDAARGEAEFADAFETELYRYYKAKNPATFTGMNDGDSSDTRFDHGLDGVARDRLFE